MGFPFRKFLNFMEITEKQTRQEEREFRKVREAVKEKKGDWLGKWLQKFSIEGDFWLREKRAGKKDWL